MLLAVVPIGLTLLQPDLSTTMLLAVLAGSMLVIGRVPARFLLPLAAAAAVSAPLLISLLRPYQVERLGSFLVGAHESPTGSGWAAAAGAHRAWAPAGCSGGPTTRCAACARSTCPSGRPTWPWPAWSGSGDWSPAPAAVLAAIILVWRLALASRASRTPHGALVGGGLAILLGVETVVSVGGNLGLLPLAGVPFPLLSYGGTALVVHLAAIGVVLAVRRDGARRRLWALPRWRNPRPRLVRLTALGLSVLLISFGVYGWRLQTTQGEALAGRRAGADDPLHPAARRPRLDHRPARRAARRERRGRRQRRGPGARGARPAARPAGGRRPPRRADRPAARGPRARSSARRRAPRCRCRWPRCPRDVGDAVTAAADRRRARRRRSRAAAIPQGALLGPVLGFAGVATPEDEQRWPDLPPGEIVGRAGLEQQYDAVLRGIDGRQCLYVDPTGVPVALGERQDPVPGADLRLSLDLGLQRQLDAGLAAAVRAQPRPRGKIGAAVAMDPRVGAGPRHGEHPVVRQQRLRAAGRRRGAAGRWPTRRVRRCSST